MKHPSSVAFSQASSFLEVRAGQQQNDDGEATEDLTDSS
ncbi:hypothetical protein FOWG_10957 [Fusarium oxysporum f. sp. lycopersici MN25]|uniref:Uncharacterized protein n=1 Tax=Fusarium oxysporum Fo47 TaxID=660027 RepID=W9JTZ0_FUSOX|nr:hypothetical protein FOZG_14252 [Fusarium oxysporum Fo47]EWZ85880.1 hypothetical protein FOWG_10957 [Fusarium oxysporum f. sp. lycopersici MN25]